MMFIENFLKIMVIVAITGIFLASFYDRKDGEK